MAPTRRSATTPSLPLLLVAATGVLVAALWLRRGPARAEDPEDRAASVAGPSQRERRPEPAPRTEPAPTCRRIDRLLPSIVGSERATLGHALRGLELGTAMEKLPTAYASWRHAEWTDTALPPALIALGPLHVATVTPGLRGYPPTLFRLTLDLAGIGLADQLGAAWGPPARLGDGSAVWTTGPAGARRRVRVREHDCRTTIVYEPYVTITELLALDLETYVGAPMRRLYKGKGAWRAWFDDCYPADGCGGFVELPPLDVHPEPLCMSADRGAAQGDGWPAVWAAPVTGASIGICQNLYAEVWLDVVDAPGRAAIRDALEARFGASRDCERVDDDPVAGRRFSRGRLDVVLDRTGIHVYRLDLPGAHDDEGVTYALDDACRLQASAP